MGNPRWKPRDLSLGRVHDEHAFLRWFTENVLYPERRIFLQNTLKKAFEGNDLVDELKSELSLTSSSIFENIKNKCDKDTIYDFVKIVKRPKAARLHIMG